MKVNMNGARRSLTCGLNDLTVFLKGLIERLPVIEAQELGELHQELAQSVGILNCVYQDGDESFTDLSELAVDQLLDDE